ncbi:LytTR family DNA-binding domain-containing protein [Lactobacillus johnsonii]|jgi:DNA-binding LytR/AlgR family response regulator|uniref:LytTR family DNA-binding domain-containing protein n=1 Tax=Lactobacillus johnsonii TaxID=33959 RepID=UPI0036587598
MKVEFNIDPNLSEEKAEFWLKKMTSKIRRITNELKSNQDFLWGYQDGDAYMIEFSQIFAIQVENEKTMICTEKEVYIFRGRLYQAEKLLPNDFVTTSRSSIVNYHFINHLEIVSSGNIDAILENGLRIQVARRKIKVLKERLGL